MVVSTKKFRFPYYRIMVPCGKNIQHFAPSWNNNDLAKSNPLREDGELCPKPESYADDLS